MEGDYVVSVLTRSFSNPDNMCRSCGGDMPSCCDAMNETSSQCAVCDGISFRYCWKLSPDSDCITYASAMPSSGPVDFDSSEVLGLPNPLFFPNTTGAMGHWMVSIANLACTRCYRG